MLLCLDVGNTHIYGGIFKGDQLAFQFRYPSKSCCTSDEFGIFLKNYLKEIGLDAKLIQKVAYCSVVSSLDYSIRSAFVKYFNIDPYVLSGAGNIGLKIKYTNPSEVGADRIATAIAATDLYPAQNTIIVDLGTATTFEVIAQNGEFLGGAIIPGLQLQMRALNEKTANLPPVRILKTNAALGQTTTSNIQSGLYYGHRGAIKEIISSISKEQFSGKAPVVIGTGGFAQLFEEDNIFDAIYPDLVLQGLKIAYQRNH